MHTIQVPAATFIILFVVFVIYCVLTLKLNSEVNELRRHINSLTKEGLIERLREAESHVIAAIIKHSRFKSNYDSKYNNNNIWPWR